MQTTIVILSEAKDLCLYPLNTTPAFASALDSDGTEAFADMAMANPLFAPYCAKGPAAQRFIRSCLMTHRARGVAHTAREVLAKRPRIY